MHIADLNMPKIRSSGAAARAKASNDDPRDLELRFNEYVQAEAARLATDQAKVNEALVAKVFQCERAEQALRASEQKLHDLLAYQLNTREEERKRISREIHDSLGQNLLALRLDVSALHQQTADHQPHLHDWIGYALENLDITIHAVRQLITDLRPFQLELGLLAAVEWELKKFARTSGIRASVTAGAEVGELVMDDECVLTVYRALQECLANVHRHSLATRADVTLSVSVSGNTLSMTVSDDGIGFDPALPPKSSSFGLLGIRERLAPLGGDLAVSSSTSRGTTVTLTLPVIPLAR
jgi:signal transduction histidine kinase